MNDEVMKWLPWALGIITTVLAIKKDWVAQKLGAAKTKQGIAQTGLEQVAAEMKIYQDLLDDVRARHKTTVEELEGQIKEMKIQIIELKEYIEENRLN